MNNFNNHEGNCSLSSVALFEDRLRQEDIIGGYWEKINPINSLDGTRVVEFAIKGNDDFIDLHNCRIQMKIRIKNTDGTNLASGKKIACINYPIATLFEQVAVYLNNNLVTNTSNYAYKAYLETTLTYNDIAKKSWLQTGGYFKDTPGKMNVLDNSNAAFQFRSSLLENSRTVELIGKIHSDLFNQERLLLNHVDLKLVFTRCADDFCLMAAAAEKVELELVDAWLVVRRNTLASHKVNEVQLLLQKQDIRYFIPRVQVKTFTFATGLLNVNVRSSLTDSDLPSRIVVGMVSNTAYNGSQILNPFRFHHYNMTSANITVDSKSVFGTPITLNVPTGQYMQAYWSLMSALGYNFRDDGCYITRNEFDNGYFLICADLSATLCNGQYNDPVQSGNLEIDLKFSAGLPETVNVIVYMEFNSTITINSSRQVLKNFA